MELAETIQTINNTLENLFGKDSVTNMPIWRVVWSEDQYEKRLVNTTPEGWELLTPMVREVPKYRQWIPEKYVLERLVIVPEQDQNELLGIKISYEPIWIFETQDGRYLPPRVDVAKFVIDTIYAAQGKKSMRKYVDEEEKNPEETRAAHIQKLYEEMFGNETETGDALAYKEGVSLSGPKLVESAESTQPTGEQK